MIARAKSIAARRLTIQAPAKVNWYLEILRRRADGFHDLSTLFVRLKLADTLTLIERPSGIVLRTRGAVPRGADNIAYRAAALIQQEAGVQKGVEIRLVKRIPLEAGLGGGSSDAAAVLLGLNRLWRLGLDRRRLTQLGARLGSDVPFFIAQTPYALAGGRGEKIRAVPSRRRFFHVLVKPSFGISTRDAYAQYARLAAQKELSLTPPRGGARILLRFLQGKRANSLPDGFFNSLEVALNKRVRNISALKDALLKQGAFAALLSGSGSTVFGVFDSRAKAQRAARAKAVRGLGRVFVTCSG